jgi:beta-fructofuranosidase
MDFSTAHANEYIKNTSHQINFLQRHKFHFMPLIGWMNDPNGFVYFQGYFHLFYQFYPYEPKWGPMHWGHARSKNLIDWEHLPVALAPDLMHEDGCFSGGGTIFNDQLILMYTSHFHQSFQRQEQSLAVSSDGLVFHKRNTPVITIDDLPVNASRTDFRDPNPVTIAGHHFILVGSSSLEKTGQILVYKTDDFKTFTYLNVIKHPLFGEIAECPDLFELDGKHVLLFSSTSLKQEQNRFKNVNSSLYAVGHFDVHTGEFKFDHADEIDSGHHYYAPQTLAHQQERICIAWMEMWGKPYFTALSNHGWVGAMTIPRLLSVRHNKVYQEPIDLEPYVMTVRDIKNLDKTSTEKYFLLSGKVSTGNPTEIKIGFANNYYLLKIDSEKIILDTNNTTLFPLEARAIHHTLKALSFRLIMDNSSLELFVDHIDKTITTRVYFNESMLDMMVSSQDIINLTLKELNR